MFGSLKPRENKFFELFHEMGGLIVLASQQFGKMIADLPRAESHAKEIKYTEHKADDVTHQTIELLHKIFITPLDREDIHNLIKSLDDIVDYIEAASQRMFLYGLTQVTPEAHSLARVCIAAAERIQAALGKLNNLK